MVHVEISSHISFYAGSALLSSDEPKCDKKVGWKNV